MRFRISRGLPWLLIGVVSVGGSRVAWGQDARPSPYHYYYFDQKVALTCDTKQVALFESAAKAGQAATLSQAVAQFGIADEKLVRSPIPTLWMAQTPTTVRDAAGVEGLVATLSTTERVAFVSPVFRDARGDPVIVSQFIHVGFHEAANRQDAEATLAGLNAGVIEARDWTGMKGVYRIKCASRNGFEVLELANRLAQMPLVKFAEPDMIMTVRKSLIPNDQFFSLLWGLHNTGQSGGTVDMDMDGPEAWDISTGDPSIVVAILDDGTQQNHPDINQVPGADFTGSGTGGGPGNACDNHGTAVAGCTSAIINNSIGVVGIAPGCKVVGLKWNRANVPCDGTGSFFISWLVNALNFAQTSGARVTNNSNGFGTSGSITSKYQSTRHAGLIHFSSSG
ncbi:MAG: S8 family serine peptidase, partial [Planctomycetes bacterium]|nr:S8 family serine peptidase [Planctomycetota bacterium]